MGMFTKSQLKRKLAQFLGLVLLMVIPALITACSAATPKGSAKNLMNKVAANPVQGQTVDDRFRDNMADFTVQLFKRATDKEKSSLVSPFSVMLALAMTANGANGETLSQMEGVLGGDIPLEELNEYLCYYASHLPNTEKSKLKIANSIWFRDEENRLTVKKDFLQKNADYYQAEVYKAPFTDNTLADINKWVKFHTDDMIDKILDEIDYDTVMYLLNAIVFDAEWEVVYNKGNIYQREFTAIDKSKKTSDFMGSEESLYLDDGSATGFVKPYYGNKYSFAALLPNENITIAEYIKNLSGGGLLKTISNAEETTVNAAMPKFSYDYEIRMNDILSERGMPNAFDPVNADFARLGSSTRGNIFIGEVLHKTFIAVDELGTRAGAVTKVEMTDECAALDMKTVILDRPFVYAIVDNATNLPIFIGTVMDL